MPKGLVTIVGRPNVGKSTLFNRLIESRQAIVHDQPGVTRDRLEGTCTWNGQEFMVVDTGGYLSEDDDAFASAIREQVEISIAESDVILFMVDAHTGMTPADEEIADLLRRSGRREVLVVVNKADTAARDLETTEFYALGIADVFPIAAASGRGTGELLDRVAELVANLPETQYEEGIPRLAIVGRPNVGKSSFVNALLGRAERVVTDIAGTTRDSRDVRFRGYGFDVYLIDTAGLRKKANVQDNVEYYSVLRSVRAIENCDVALMMLDADMGIEAQDLKIIALINKHLKGMVILVNKWDTQEKTKFIDKKFREIILERMAPRKAPIVFTSATAKIRLHKALETAQDVYDQRNKRITTAQLNRDLLPIIENTPPPAVRGKGVRINFVSQIESRCPTFLFFCNYPDDIRPPYERFLENQIRKLYGFNGWPIRIIFKRK